MEGASTFTQTRPHFFKPLLQGFYQGLSIPVAFLKNLNLKKRADESDALLRTECGEWKVKIKAWRFEGGWIEFAKHHDLHVGDFLVFKHLGNLVFDVSVFGPSTCRREYTKRPRKREREREMPRSNYDKRICVTRSKKEHQKEARLAGLKAEASSLATTYPSFRAILKPSSMNREFYIQEKFARVNGLSGRHGEMITLIDGDHEGQRSWQVKLTRSGTQVYLSTAWNELRVANALKVGDTVSFTLVENGERAVMVFNKIKESHALEWI